jgi:phenylacetate-CoA ligase
MTRPVDSHTTPQRQALEAEKCRRLNALLAEVVPANQFYAEKFAECPRQVDSLEAFAAFPLTTKTELIAPNGQATNRTWPDSRYVRFHQTSGTRGQPLQVWDTAADWAWWLDCWRLIYDRAGLRPGEGVFVAASFGPYVGFWSAFEAAVASGGRAIPAGGLSSLARLDLLQRTEATVLVATPSYALHLAEVARQEGIDTAASAVRCVLVAGEPGGSIPAVRERIAAAWQAQVLDHAGATEIGPWGVGRLSEPGLEVIEDWFYPEFLALDDDRPAGEGELAELVLTTLGRTGCPVIRYRTGDVVRPHWPAHSACHELVDAEAGLGKSAWVQLVGGVLGRVDDMLIIRGMNVFPSAIENIVRGFPEVEEFRLTVRRQGSLDSLELEIEDRLEDPGRVAGELHRRLGLRVEVLAVPAGSLPRFSGKARRVVDARSG